MEDDKKLKDIFSLMFEKLKSISIGDNFIKEIDLRRVAEFDKNKPDSFFYEKLVATIHVSGYKVSILRNRWDDIKKAFSNYDLAAVSRFTNDDLARMMKNPKLIKNKRKLKACIENAKIMAAISIENGSFGNYLEKYKNNLDDLAGILINKFHFLGRVLVFNYLKEVGIDAIKPDVHVVRVMYRLGLIDSEDESLENIDKVIVVAKEMAGVVGEKLNVVDAVFWMYGGSGDNHVKTAICSKNKPLCEECLIRGYCTRKAGQN
jgi:DNA-3-methyladenine glycosylase I